MPNDDPTEHDETAASDAPVGDPRVFDRFRLIRLLGRGGMGEVWLARDELLDRSVALKFVSDVLGSQTPALEALKKETRRCLGLTHPNIVRVYDLMIDPAKNRAAIAMECVEGQTLKALRDSHKPPCFSAEALSKWVGQLCEALTYAHESARIVHRDLKPANLMIDQAGQLKIMDFGIAKALAASATQVTAVDSSGTLAFMSPQQLQSQPPAITDDIYSLGATLYDLLTGAPPFRGNLQSMLQQILEQAPPSLHVRRSQISPHTQAPIPQHWQETIVACLAKSPHERPQNAREVWQRLNLESGHTPSAEPKRGRRVLALGTVVVLAAVGTGTWALLHSAQERSTAQRLATPATEDHHVRDRVASPSPEPMATPVIVRAEPTPVREPPPTPTPMAAPVITAKLSKTTYKIGESLELSITSARDCYVRVVQFGADQSTTQLLPNRFQPDNFIRAGSAILLPDPAKSSTPYELATSPPAGKEKIVVFVAAGQFVDLPSLTAAGAGNFPLVNRADLYTTRGAIRIQARTPQQTPAEVVAASVEYQLVE